MLNLKKHYNLKITLAAISIILLLINGVYASDTLRLQSGEGSPTVSRMAEIIEAKELVKKGVLAKDWRLLDENDLVSNLKHKKVIKTLVYRASGDDIDIRDLLEKFPSVDKVFFIDQKYTGKFSPGDSIELLKLPFDKYDWNDEESTVYNFSYFKKTLQEIFDATSGFKKEEKGVYSIKLYYEGRAITMSFIKGDCTSPETYLNIDTLSVSKVHVPGSDCSLMGEVDFWKAVKSDVRYGGYAYVSLDDDVDNGNFVKIKDFLPIALKFFKIKYLSKSAFNSLILKKDKAIEKGDILILERKNIFGIQLDILSDRTEEVPSLQLDFFKDTKTGL